MRDKLRNTNAVELNVRGIPFEKVSIALLNKYYKRIVYDRKHSRVNI